MKSKIAEKTISLIVVRTALRELVQVPTRGEQILPKVHLCLADVFSRGNDGVLTIP